MIAPIATAVVIVTVLVGGTPTSGVRVDVSEGYQHGGTSDGRPPVRRTTNRHGEVRLSVSDAPGDITWVHPYPGGRSDCRAVRINRPPRKRPYDVTISCPAS